MATHTLTIPTTTFPVGQTTVGPLTVSSNLQATITLDRTLPGGLNSLTSASIMQVTIQSSPDNTTWTNEVSTLPDGFTGGTILDGKTGLPITTDFLSVNGLNPGTRHVRALVNVVGPSSIVTGGTVVVS